MGFFNILFTFKSRLSILARSFKLYVEDEKDSANGNLKVEFGVGFLYMHHNPNPIFIVSIFNIKVEFHSFYFYPREKRKLRLIVELNYI
jgi:hypothetical protein